MTLAIKQTILDLQSNQRFTVSQLFDDIFIILNCQLAVLLAIGYWLGLN